MTFTSAVKNTPQGIGLSGPHWSRRDDTDGRASRFTARKLRVRMVGRLTASDAVGGGEIQQIATQEYLNKLGIDARPLRPWEDNFSDFDVLHLFGSRPEFVELSETARRHGVKVVLSPVAWFDALAYWNEPRPLLRRVLACTNHFLRGACPTLPSWRRRLYRSVDLLLPNSEAEAGQLHRLFSVDEATVRVVRNGAHERFASTRPAEFVSRFGIRNFVLCAGRIEPRKNQLVLLKAMQDCDVPLVVLGDAVPGHEDYYAACRLAAGENVFFIEAFQRNDPMLASAYAACSCLALVSRFETPGLVALEAGMLGKPLVLTNHGSCREYFGELAHYVSPDDPRGIRRAIQTAVDQPCSDELARHVRTHFNWRSIARDTFQAYAKLL